MKIIKITSLLLVLATLLQFSCTPPQGNTEGPSGDQDSTAHNTNSTVSVKELQAFLPQQLEGYEPREEGNITSDEDDAVEVNASFISSDNSVVNISIADLKNYPNLYENFLAGGGLYQSTAGKSFNLGMDKEIDLPMVKTTGFSLHQSTAYGALELAQSTGEMLFNTDQGSFILWGGDEVAFEQASKIQAGIPQEIVEKAGGIEKLDKFMQATALNVGEMVKTDDGSYFMPFSKDVGEDVAGWVLFDKNAGVGMMLLGVNKRFAIVIEGNDLDNMKSLQALSEKFDFSGLATLAHDKS